MISENLYNKLSQKQKELLERATAGKTIEKSTVVKVKAKVEEISREEEFQEWIPIPYELRDTVCKRGILSTEAEEDFNELYRYLNSLEADEEKRRQRLIEYANEGYKDIQIYIYRRIDVGEETIEKIKEDTFYLEDILIANLGVRFGFKYEEVSEIIKYEFDFNKNEIYGKSMQPAEIFNQLFK